MEGYRAAICKAMLDLAQDDRRRFVGYNVKCGRAGGTLDGVPEYQLVETPVAENLMAGIAIGLSLTGYKPVLYFERMDFIMNAMDAIVNHLDKLDELSDGQFSPKIIIRCVVGNRDKPLFTGPTHTQNFSEAMRHLVRFRIIEADNVPMLEWAYRRSAPGTETVLIAEFKDLY